MVGRSLACASSPHQPKGFRHSLPTRSGDSVILALIHSFVCFRFNPPLLLLLLPPPPLNFGFSHYLALPACFKRTLLCSSKIPELVMHCLVLPPSGVCQLTHVHELVEALALPQSACARLLLCSLQRAIDNDEELVRTAIAIKHFCRVEETKIAMAQTPFAFNIFAESCRMSTSSDSRNELARAMANIATVEQGARIFCDPAAIHMFRFLISCCEDNVPEVIGIACALNNITARMVTSDIPCCFSGDSAFEIWESLSNCTCQESMSDETREWACRVFINLFLSQDGQCNMS